jgi:hypothetical protein
MRRNPASSGMRIVSNVPNASGTVLKKLCALWKQPDLLGKPCHLPADASGLLQDATGGAR